MRARFSCGGGLSSSSVLLIGERDRSRREARLSGLELGLRLRLLTRVIRAGGDLRRTGDCDGPRGDFFLRDSPPPVSLLGRGTFTGTKRSERLSDVVRSLDALLLSLSLDAFPSEV